MKNRITLYRMTAAALLMALVFVLGMTPLGLIPLGFINVTILCVPVITGALVLGARSGLLLGLCFGTASTLSMLGISLTPPSALASTLFAASPACALIMCYAPRLLVPMAALGVYKLLGKHEKIALPIAAAAGSLTNTVLYTITVGLVLPIRTWPLPQTGHHGSIPLPTTQTEEAASRGIRQRLMVRY